MTREEAKREILFAKREVMADSWIDKAYDMAIKALQQPEVVCCEDCVHRVDTPIADGRYWCKIHDAFMYYCSDAERREG